MVVSSQLLTSLEDAIDNSIILVSQIVLTCFRDGTAIEVTTTDGRYENGGSTLFLDSVNNLLQTSLVGC